METAASTLEELICISSTMSLPRRNLHSSMQARPLTFFECYSLELQQQAAEKQKKKVEKQKLQKPRTTTILEASSTRPVIPEDLYPPKNPDKQTSHQLVITALDKYSSDSKSAE
jgi:hypothetical protein